MEGYLEKLDNGRYGVCDLIELTCGDCIDVKTVSGWLRMCMEHDGIDYVLVSKGFSCYPKKVYVRKPR